MKKLVLSLILLSGTAGAVEVDCSTPHLVDTLGLNYSTKPGFPNKPDDLSVYLPDLKVPLTFCGVTFASQAKQVITIESKQLTSLEYLTNEFRAKDVIEFDLIAAQPYGRADKALSVQFSLYPTFNTYSVQAIINPVKVNDTVLGIRFDGGALQPLFYNGRSPSLKFSKAIKVIEVYAKSKFDLSWQRVTLNIQKPKITVYLKSVFPQK